MSSARQLMAPTYALEAVKGCWMFAISVEVEGQTVPVHHIVSAAEGPEAWIAVEEGKEYTVSYSVRKNSNNGHAFLEDYPDFEVSCCSDGDLVDVNLSRFKEVTSKEGATGRFEGRQLQKKRMRRLIFSRPHTTKKQTKANIDRMGTIEVAFQRCDASHGEAFVNKETLPVKTLNERVAIEHNVDMVTSFGPVEPSTKGPTNVTGTIAPPDSGDFVSMQFRYVTPETLIALGYMENLEPVAPSPPKRATTARKTAAASSRARETQVVAPARELSEQPATPTIAAVPQVVEEIQGLIGAIATMNKTLLDKLSRLQKGKTAEIVPAFTELTSISSAIQIMKSPLQTKLRTLAAGSGGGSSMARYGPAAEEVQDMAGAVFAMNKALQEKMKELQNGSASGHVLGLRELEAMSNALRLMNDSMQEKLEGVAVQEQSLPHRRSPDSERDDDRSARRVTAKRRKIV